MQVPEDLQRAAVGAQFHAVDSEALEFVAQFFAIQNLEPAREIESFTVVDHGSLSKESFGSAQTNHLDDPQHSYPDTVCRLGLGTLAAGLRIHVSPQRVGNRLDLESDEDRR